MRETTWSNIGKDVRKCRDYRSVLQDAGLDYDVIMKPGRVRVNGREVRTGDFYTMRKGDPGHIYGRVSSGYHIIQNETAFKFADYISDDMTFVRAGETSVRRNAKTGGVSGGMVWMIGALPETDILGDKFTPHIIMANSFAGQMSLRVAICFLRILCQNQFSGAFRNSNGSLFIRHDKNAREAIETGKLVMRGFSDSLAEFSRMADGYATMKISPRQIGMALDAMFPIKGDEPAEVVARVTREKRRFAEAFEVAYNAPDNANFTGTAWGLINAYFDVITHQDRLKKVKNWEENRFVDVTFGNHTDIFAVIDSVAV